METWKMEDPFTPFTLYSNYDDGALACRLYIPKHTAPLKKIAIIAHPYAPLGGSYNDHVVISLTEELYLNETLLVTFNFRGATPSEGKTSWTGSSEIQDFETIILFVTYLWSTTAFFQEEIALNLCLAGYSYGSQICKRLPSLQAIFQKFENNKAKKQTELYWKSLVNTKFKLSQFRPGTIFTPSLLHINDCYLLVSPLLPPTAWFINLSWGNSNADEDDDAALKFKEKSILATWGSSDNFTSGSKLMKWAKLIESDNSKFTWKEFENIGHFWHEKDAIPQLCKQVNDWFQSVLQP